MSVSDTPYPKYPLWGKPHRHAWKRQRWSGTVRCRLCSEFWSVWKARQEAEQRREVRNP